MNVACGSMSVGEAILVAGRLSSRTAGSIASGVPTLTCVRSCTVKVCQGELWGQVVAGSMCSGLPVILGIGLRGNLQSLVF